MLEDITQLTGERFRAGESGSPEDLDQRSIFRTDAGRLGRPRVHGLDRPGVGCLHKRSAIDQLAERHDGGIGVGEPRQEQLLDRLLVFAHRGERALPGRQCLLRLPRSQAGSNLGERPLQRARVNVLTIGLDDRSEYLVQEAEGGNLRSGNRPTLRSLRVQPVGDRPGRADIGQVQCAGDNLLWSTAAPRPDFDLFEAVALAGCAGNDHAVVCTNPCLGCAHRRATAVVRASPVGDAAAGSVPFAEASRRRAWMASISRLSSSIPDGSNS